MKNKSLSMYYLFACIGVLLASYYPLYMGVRVVADMLADGSVLKENYPKYIIPYTPVCVAVLTGVLILPLCVKLLKRFALLGGSVVSAGVFFALEILFEKNVVVTAAGAVSRLEDWQMYMCYTKYDTLSPVDILTGNYNPAFKLHFYVISIVLIISLLNCLYGFAQMIYSGNKKRLKALVLQTVSSLVFLFLCILACFTAFWRDGGIQVSPVSAVLMTAFFVVFGVTVGIYAGSFLLGRHKFVSIWIPALISAIMTILMYIGEMILLNRRLYSFGTGFFFEGLPGIVLAPVDLMVILFSGCVTALILVPLNRKPDSAVRSA